jgi:tetratricopeptide (TPR) repeat protein
MPPPVLGLTGSTGPEGLVILDEVRGQIGAFLWRAFRRTALWSFRQAGQTEDRPGGTSKGGEASNIDALRIPDELHGPLSVLSAGGTSEEEACEAGEAAAAIGRWATRTGRQRTSAEFFQLAGCARPFDAACAIGAARATHAIGDHARAEIWFQRSAALAARQGDWKMYLDAHLGYGALLREKGDLRRARKWLGRAARRAERQGLRAYRDRTQEALAMMAS